MGPQGVVMSRGPEPHPARLNAPMRRLVLVPLLALMLTPLLPMPIVDAQDVTGACPANGRSSYTDYSGNTPPTPEFFDFRPEGLVVTVQNGTGSEKGTAYGAYTHYETTGHLKVKYDVRNIGWKNPSANTGPLETTITLTKPSGQSETLTINLPDAPGRNQIKTANTEFTLTQQGTYKLDVKTNPTHAAANAAAGTGTHESCSSTTSTATTTYYGNNNLATFNMLVGDLPDLVVERVDVVRPPVRASSASNDDTKATIETVIQNKGTAEAFSLTTNPPGSDAFIIALTIEGATCVGKKLVTQNADNTTTESTQTGANGRIEIKRLAAGKRATATYDCQMPNLAGKQTINVTADADKEVQELLENNNLRQGTVEVPAADLIANIHTQLTQRDGVYLLKAGRDLHFNVTVENNGKARAASSTNGNFGVDVKLGEGKVDDESMTLDALASVTFPVSVTKAALAVRPDPYTVSAQADVGNVVIESNENNNIGSIKVLVARFEAEISAENVNVTRAPGAAGAFAFTLENKGNVGDIYQLTVEQGTAVLPNNTTANVSAADLKVSNVRFVDRDGDNQSQVDLSGGTSRGIEMRATLPRDAPKGTAFPITIIAASLTEGSDAEASFEMNYITGDDDVPPEVTRHRPRDKFFGGNNVTFRVTDNVGVAKVETDITGGFVEVRADREGGELYTINVAGHPGSFTLRVRATDTSGIQVVTNLEFVRDTAPPRITDWAVTPTRGVLPGSTVRIELTVDEDNPKRVGMTAIQPGHYQERFDATRTGAVWTINWKTPQRPGRFHLYFEAEDQAGNVQRILRDTSQEIPQAMLYNDPGGPGFLLYVQGLNIRAAGNPIARPVEPAAGETVTFTYVIENTSPRFETGTFRTRFALDREIFLDEDVLNLQPRERRTLQYTWEASKGYHEFVLLLDQADQVPEDNEGDNFEVTDTDILFSGQALFTPAVIRDEGFLTFNERLATYWHMPVLLLANVALFFVAILLRTRPVQ